MGKLESETRAVISDAGRAFLLILIGIVLLVVTAFVADGLKNPLLAWFFGSLLGIPMLIGLWTIWAGLKAPTEEFSRRRKAERDEKNDARIAEERAAVDALLTKGLTINEIARHVGQEPLLVDFQVKELQSECGFSRERRLHFQIAFDAVLERAGQNRPFKCSITKTARIAPRSGYCRVVLNENGTIKFKSRDFDVLAEIVRGVEIVRIKEQSGDFGELQNLLSDFSKNNGDATS